MSLATLLAEQRHLFAPLLPSSWQQAPALLLDLSDPSWQCIDSHDIAALTHHTQQLCDSAGAQFAVGRYAEKRTIYARDMLFKADDKIRNVHIGLDIMLPQQTELYAPFTGIIHSIANHQTSGDYGPTLILQHQLQHEIFYTLYGHLNLASIQNKKIGQIIPAGESFAAVGDSNINGHWPTHVHLQIIHQLAADADDYPGVVHESDLDFYLKNCPDPNLIVNLNYINPRVKKL